MSGINVTVTATTPMGVTVELTSTGHSMRSLPFILGKMLVEAEQATLQPYDRRYTPTPSESAQEESHVT